MRTQADDDAFKVMALAALKDCDEVRRGLLSIIDQSQPKKKRWPWHS